MALKFEPPVKDTARFPENYLPTALPLLLGSVSTEGFYPLIPVPIPLTASASLETISGKILADPAALVDLMAKRNISAKNYIGPKMSTHNAAAFRKIDIPLFGAPNNVDVTVVIDASIAFWNPRFAYATGKNRFADIGFLAFNKSENGIPAVQFIGQTKINALAAMNQSQGYDRGIIDDLGARFPESVYGMHSEAGRLFAPDGFNHGTAIADLAAGKNPDDQSSAPVLFGIELPSAVLLDANGESLQAVLSLAIHEAIVRVFNWASEDGRAYIPQIKIVLPYAFLGGPHDGEHPVVQNIEQYVSPPSKEPYSIQFFVPMGNHQQDQLHAEFGDIDEHKTSQPSQLQWFLQPDDYSSNTVEITFEGDPCQELQLATPEGDTAKAILGDGTFSILTVDGSKKVGAVWTRSINKDQTRIRLSLGATAHVKPTGQRVPAGNWSIALKAAAGKMKNVQLWILREDGTHLTRRSFPARQSYFKDPKYQKYAPSGGFSKDDLTSATIRRLGTVSIMATSAKDGVNNVGAIENIGGRKSIAWYSGRPHSSQNTDIDVLVDDGSVSRGAAALVNGSARNMRISGTSVSVAKASAIR